MRGAVAPKIRRAIAQGVLDTGMYVPLPITYNLLPKEIYLLSLLSGGPEPRDNVYYF